MQINIAQIDRSQIYLVAELFNKYRVFYKQPSDVKLAQNFIQARLDNNESVVFVASIVQDGNVLPVGFTQLYPKFSSGKAMKIWVLNDLYVEAEFRKNGIGEGLINTALEYAKTDNVAYVELSTAVDNCTAQKLYESIGFIQQPPSTEFLNYKIEIT